jgi:hypothetical protein
LILQVNEHIIRIHESAPKDLRLFEADETGFLLTFEQAEGSEGARVVIGTWGFTDTDYADIALVAD